MSSASIYFCSRPLLLLRPSLMVSTPSVLHSDAVTISKFMVFTVHLLNHSKFFTTIVLDGYSINWTGWKGTHPNILRGLLRVTLLISPETKFVLFFDMPLDEFQLESANLNIVSKKLTYENMTEELGLILYGRSA